MKKFALLFVLMPLLHSCSSDSDGTSSDQLTPNGTLVKKIIKTSTSGTSAGTVTSTDYFYNGNKIIKAVVPDGHSLQYTYTGDLITRLDVYLNNVVIQTDNYLYDSQQRLIERKILLQNNTARRSDFTYNSDGTVTIKIYMGDYTAQNNLSGERKIFLYPNGDVEKIERYMVISGNNVTKTDTFIYDSMSQTGTAVLGANKVKLWDDGTSGNAHNLISSTSTTTENSSTYTVNFSYTYNTLGYPATYTDPGNSYEFLYQQP